MEENAKGRAEDMWNQQCWHTFQKWQKWQLLSRDMLPSQAWHSGIVLITWYDFVSAIQNIQSSIVTQTANSVWGGFCFSRELSK